ncbi:hypothetical protein CL632_02950 [bacterium]|jgi:hypothetical protein|nr:hypothetical protein [bacterium]MDP6571388.1 hypothetical protein [Patescibacteria group bacterium]|tara:strand:+ start:24218 stop:24652 length:435 start_codon:yes stop_codon:yes gene_type:complete
MAEEEKQENIWKFYFQSRWQTALTVHYLVAVAYLVLFFIGNLWIFFKFAFFSLITSARQLGLEFALWAIIFELTVMVPFFTSWYAIFLLPQIWRSRYTKMQKTWITILMIVVFILIIVITDTIARFALDSEVLREFADIHKIKL